ncbi:MAG: protein kinase [Acaryochloridaceae cyanobacterium RL_2_7]|nr:protein kinase [Acaryochloridaceae cyanobacterium RL_2_7]
MASGGWQFELKPGDYLGAVDRYVIQKQIGKGGFGITYLAQDKQEKHPVVIKVMQVIEDESYDLEKQKQDFKNEAFRLRGFDGLGDPHIVRCLDIIEDKRFFPALVMEYVEGQSLDKYKKSQVFISEEQALVYLKQLAGALDKIHNYRNEGFLHRDISPANVIIRKAKDEAVLIDFGSAREICQENKTLHKNPMFAAPESKLHEDARSDIYSLCLTIYNAMTGSLPDESHRLPASSCVSNELLVILQKGCEFKPEERYQTAKVFLEHLEKLDCKVLVEEPLHSLSFSPSLLGRAEGKRPPGLGDLGGECNAVHTFPITFSKPLENEPITLMTPNPGAKQLGNTHLFLNKYILSFLAACALMVTASGLIFIPRIDSSLTKEKSQDPITDLNPGSTGNNEKPSRIDELLTLAEDLYHASDYEVSIRSFSQVLKSDSDNLTALSGRGLAQMKMKNYSAAIKDFSQALSIDSKLPLIFINRGVAKYHLRQYGSAIKDFDEATDLDNRNIDAYINKGLALTALNKYQAAISEFDNASAFDQTNVDIFINRGVAKLKDGQAKQDRRLVQQAVYDFDRALKVEPSHPNAYLNRAFAHTYLGNQEDADSDFQKSKSPWIK